jgi:hypothetical protein
MKLFWSLFVLPSGAFAHMMSMSTGDISIQGAKAHYTLRMPSYEMAHVKDRERSLFDQIRFSNEGHPARRLNGSCREDMAQAVYICDADYEFSSAVDRLQVECTFYSVTVPNHVHLLRAERNGRRDQAIFDVSFPQATIRFEPPSAVEVAVTQMGAGALRAAGGLVEVLFLATLVLAARSRRELMAMAGMFLTGQVASALLTPLTGWQPAPRFVEAAAALTIAYLAVEVLLMPDGRMRWVIAGVLGAFHGLYFDLFLQASGYRPVYVLAGAGLAQVALIAVFGLAFALIGRIAAALRPVQISASVLLAIGMVWFFLRLKG